MKNLIIIWLVLTGSSSFAQVVYSGNINNNWDLYTIDLTTKQIKRITRDSLKDFQSDYCPIRRQLVFDSYRDKDTRNLFILDSGSENITQLTRLATRDGHPAWSPDCRQIAFQSSRSGNPDVWVMESSGENARQLTFSEEFDGIPTWSPPGDLIAFNSNRSGSPNIFTINPETREIIQVTNDEHNTFIQDWVSDKEILIISDMSGKRQLQLVNLHTNLRKAIPTSSDVTYARFGKDGNIVFTQEDEHGVIQVYLTNLSGAGPEQLTRTDGEKRFPAFME